MFQPQLSNKALAELCHRLAIENDSGIDLRRTWQRETDISRGRILPYMATVRDAVAHGETLADALASTLQEVRGEMLRPVRWVTSRGGR